MGHSQDEGSGRVTGWSEESEEVCGALLWLNLTSRLVSGPRPPAPILMSRRPWASNPHAPLVPLRPHRGGGVACIHLRVCEG